jgi:hypothetical protein
VPRSRLVLVVAALAVVASFGAGYITSAANSKGFTIYVGDCYAASKQASCTVGNDTYGVSEVVSWTDASGVGRGGPNDPGEWPACLPPLTETKNVRFAGAMLPAGPDSFAATIVWVDCRER